MITKNIITIFLAGMLFCACAQNNNVPQSADFVTKTKVLIDSSVTIISNSESNTELNHENPKDSTTIVKPDSAKIEIWGDVTRRITFHLYNKGISFVKKEHSEQKIELSKSFSELINISLGKLFVSKEEKLILQTKYSEEIVEGGWPHFTFKIYSNGNVMSEAMFVSERQGNMKIIYSETFNNLYDSLINWIVTYRGHWM